MLPIKIFSRFKSIFNCWIDASTSFKFIDGHFPSTQCVFIQSKKDYYLFYYDDGDENAVFSESPKGLVKLGLDFEAEGKGFSLVGSCNGLVCLASYSGQLIVILNPVTCQFRKISTPDCRLNSKGVAHYWGFGYALSIDDYKVIKITEIPETLETVVHVFSFRSNAWRKLNGEQYQSLFSLRTRKYTQRQRCSANECDDGQGDGDELHEYPLSFISERGVLINETLYWIVASIEGMGRNIVAFDLVLETFDEFPHLCLQHSDGYSDNFLCAIRGRLTKCGVNMVGNVFITVFECPGKEFSFDLRGLSLGLCKDLVGFTSTGKLFIVDESFASSNSDKRFGLAEPRSSPAKYTPILKFKSKDEEIRIANYVPSMTSPSPFSGLEVEDQYRT